MKFPEYCYVDVAWNGVQNRNKVMHVRTIGKGYIGHRECYMTFYRYNQEMLDHFQDRQTVKGFDGSVYAAWLPIDIDSQDLHEAQEMLDVLVNQNFESFDIDPNVCRYYFSGAKGFHVMIPSALFDCRPAPDNDKRFRAVATALSRGIKIDTAIYNKTRLFRLPNTINAKTGLYKHELLHYEAANMSVSEILERAKQPIEPYDIEEEFDVNEELKAIYETPLEQSKVFQSNKPNGNRGKLCMARLLEGVSAGERDNVGIRIVAHLRQSGLTQKQIWSVLTEWNDTNKPALETYELERLLNQGTQEYSFGCHDHILKQYCSKECPLYRTDWGRFV
jgi:hypothetical protein